MQTAADPQAGLFWTTLVKTQTNVESRSERKRREAAGEKTDPEFDRICRREQFRPQPVTPVERDFRHGGWRIERDRVTAALAAACVPLSRLERFCECGSDCIVEYSKTAGRHRTRANYCGDRFCLPCAKARAYRVRRRVEKLCGDVLPLMITLTVRNVPGTLTERLNHLLSSFRRLRSHVDWKDAIQAGAAFVEVKKGARSGEWHPHLHIIAVGRYLPGKRLSDAWLKATGDSFRVDIQRARSATDAGSYAAKYASKGWTSDVARDHDALMECVLSLRGRRLCTTFGDWHGIDVEDDADVANDWERVGRLDFIHGRFLAGEEWARGVMVSLLGDAIEHSEKPPAPE